MTNGDRPHLRIAGVLMRLMNGKPNYSKLAREIEVANPGHEERWLDRRKLAQLVADDPADPVTLSLDELIGLDAFLSQYGEGLADRPLFEKRSPMRSLSADGRVSVVVGAYPRESPQRNDISRWDLLATAEILRAIEKAKPGTIGTIKDALFGEESPRLPSYLRRTGPSVCSIGSPRACFASEHVLASMFETTPFGAKSAAALPVRFFWSQPSGGVSSFQGDPAELSAHEQALAKDLESGRAWAVLKVNDTVFPVQHPKKAGTWESYGVVLAQRQAEGQVWVIAAGLSGPETLACARALASNSTGEIPEPSAGVCPIRWDVVRATITRFSGKRGDPRKLGEQQVVDHGIL